VTAGLSDWDGSDMAFCGICDKHAGRGRGWSEGGFRAKVDAPGGLIEVFLARFTTMDPPFEWTEQHGARFIDLTQARGLPAVEPQFLRRAYERIPV